MIFRKISIDPAFCIAAAILLLLIPIQWVFCWFFLVFTHEMGHYLALRILNIPVAGIKIGLRGAVMETGPMFWWQELLCTAAGPAAGLLLIALRKAMPVVAICAFIQSMYNLLPVYPLDGGRVLLLLTTHLFGQRWGAAIGQMIGFIVFACLMFLSLYAVTVIGTGILPLLIVVAFGFRHTVKMTCKDLKTIVQ